MTVRIEKPSINVREKLAELDKPTGIAGEAMLRAETPQEQFNLIGAGRRNLIINGAMQVAQRSTSVSVSGTGFSYDSLDRMETGKSNVDDIVVTSSQATDAPDGFSYSYKLDVTTAESAIAADEYYRGLQYTIEGQDLAALAYGTSSAKPVTLSFWVKSSLAGTYSLTFYRDESTDRVYSTSYTVDAVGVWEYKTITIEGDTSSGITSDNAGRLSISWHLFAGSNFKGGNIVGWENYSSSADLAAHHAVDWGTSTSDYWQITGVQLELGKVATPFEHRSYGEELALCQRYFWQVSGNASDQTTFGNGYSEDTDSAQVSLFFPVEMRDAPSTTIGNNDVGESSVEIIGSGVAANASLHAILDPSRLSVRLRFNADSGTPFTAGHAIVGRLTGSTSAYIYVDAEL